MDRSEGVSDGLAALASATGSRFVPLDPSWYGLDPVHIRGSAKRGAWQRIVGGHPPSGLDTSTSESVQLRLLPPERRWLFGVEQFTPQTGAALRSGGRVWIY